MRICCRCKLEKDETLFYNRFKDKKSKCGECKECTRIRTTNNEKYKLRRKLYNIKNKEKLNIKKKIYTKTHSYEKSIYDVMYREKNKTKIAKYKRDWEIERRKNDVGYRIKHNLRRRLIHALNGNLKADKTLNLLGCDVKFLREHLEKRFVTGMSWDNYGIGNNKWHIDHIIPCCKFDLSRSEDQRKCFHYSNLQPLWQKDNLTKGRKIII